jgi:hypothetical protein
MTTDEARRNVRLDGLKMVLDGIARGTRAAAQGRTVTRPQFERNRSAITPSATKPQERDTDTASPRAA